MRLLLVNLNTTRSMTATVAASAAAVARPDTVIEATNPHTGPIEHREPRRRTSLHTRATRRTHRRRYVRPPGDRPDAYVLTRFGDPGLAEARAMLEVPVLGIAQAAMHAAALVAGSFSVVTSTSATVPPRPRTRQQPINRVGLCGNGPFHRAAEQGTGRLGDRRCGGGDRARGGAHQAGAPQEVTNSAAR